jgi:hypothetical protein
VTDFVTIRESDLDSVNPWTLASRLRPCAGRLVKNKRKRQQAEEYAGYALLTNRHAGC